MEAQKVYRMKEEQEMDKYIWRMGERNRWEMRMEK